MSSPNKNDQNNIFKLIGRLADKKNRAKFAKQLAESIGSEDLIIFISDPELHILLPADGFLQTLPEAHKWNKFLQESVEQTILSGNLPYPNTTSIKPITGIAYKDLCVAVFIGGKANSEQLQKIFSVLPLLSTVLLQEQEAIHIQAELSLAKKSYSETQSIAKKLDEVRRELQKSLRDNEKEIQTRKQTEIELKTERKKIYDLFMQAPAMIAVSRGPNLIFELANPLYLKAVGKTKNIIGKGVLEVFPELIGQPILNILENVLKTGESFFGKEMIIKIDINEDGIPEDVYFNFVYKATYDAEGNIDGIMTHAIDVTPQVEARKRIEEAEMKFRTLADNIPNLTWMADADGYIYWYNSRWYEYTGTQPNDMEGWGWQSVHDPKVLPKVLDQWKSSIESGQPFEMVFPLKGADAIFRPFLTRVVPVYDENQKIVQWFGTNTDITKQKQLERQKDDFLGIASHELKTPVTSIKAYGQVLQTIFQRKGDIKAAEQLKKMDAQIDKLTSLIADLLDVTKIQSGRMEFHEDFFDFNELVNELIEQLQLTTEKHSIIKKLDKTTFVYGDRERTGQVITNLISNAIKYSPHSEKIIVKTSSDNKNITLCVQDFGVGIPSDKKDKVFEQFYRVSGDKETTFPGLGLGLYVSSEIIKREGGKIWVESVEGKGSTFCFTLPINNKAKQQKNQLNEEEVQHE